MRISRTVFKVQSYRADGIVSGFSRHSRGITKKLYFQELWFLRSAYRLMLVKISMAFHEDILNGFLSYGDTERTALYSVLGIFHERSYANRAIIKHSTLIVLLKSRAI